MEQEKDGLFFTVDEMLQVENGQEIDEMLGISLDPDISLQQYESYIQIRGLIVLQGEYRKREQTESLANVRRDRAILMEKITEKNEDITEFMHRFPVDISIPKDRVNHPEDVRVLVEVFDYALPDAYSLHIQATIHIKGIKSAQTPKEREPEPELEAEVEEPFKNEVVEPQWTEKNSHESKKDLSIDHKTTMQTDSEMIEKDENAVLQEEPVEDDKKEMDIRVSEAELTEKLEEQKEVSFLIDMFSDREEETKTTMKLYFIQEEDTIETVAKKYDVSALELIRENELTDGTLTEGQCLHIPQVNY